jgi:hypothetical protein
METMNTLNTTDGWEEIVNGNYFDRASARERVAALKKERKLRKLLKAAGLSVLACIASVVLGELGIVAGWLYAIAIIVSLALTAFNLGRYVEAEKR